MEENIDLIHLIKYYKSKLRIIITILSIFIILGLIYCIWLNKSYYKAETKLTTFSIKYDLSEETSYAYIDNAVIKTYPKIITSKRILNKVINDLKLDIEYEDLKKKINIEIETNVAIITISVIDEKEDIAINIANKIGKYFLEDLPNIIDTKYHEVKLLESATDTTNDYKLSNTKIMLMTTCIGLITGIGIVYLKYYFDKTNKTIDEISKFNTNIIGKIHKINNNKILKEEYNIIKNNLINQNNPKVILITSSENNEGKDEIAYNLSKVHAESNQKTALLNFDYKYQLKNSNSLINLIKKYDISKVVESDIKNLYIISRVNDNQINYNEITKLTNLLVQDFDKIIINGLPINGYSDTIILANLANTTLLVTSINNSRQDNIKESINTLNSNIKGIIVNNIPLNKSDEKKYEN